MTKAPIISTRVTFSEIEQIDRAAADRGLKRSELVHEAVLKYIVTEPLLWEVD